MKSTVMEYTYPKHQQRGATLITALVMLIVLTLLTFSAIKSSIANLRIVGNAQTGGEAAAAAQQTIEKVISTNFTANPVPVSAVVGSYTVNVPTPTCSGSTPILNSALDPTNPDDQPCFSSGSANNTGIFFVSGVSHTMTVSWCYRQKWDVEADVSDAVTGAIEQTHQGVALKVAAGTTC